MDRSHRGMSSSRLCDHLSLDDFVFLNPTGLSLSPTDTRSNFFLHIGLQESIYRHRLIYRKMKAEAKAGMERLFSTRKSLQPELIHDLHIVPPYNLTQITESAFQREVEKIYEASSKQTRGIYDIVGGNNGNWAIRWMLWHVVQGRLAEEVQATSSGADNECSRPSTCTSAMRGSFLGLQTPQTSPACYTIGSSHDYSDSDDWEYGESKVTIIKQENDASYHKPATTGRSSFWADVMNT